MIEKYSIRTDLALEQKERFEADRVEIPGVELHEEYDRHLELQITTVVIKTEKGAAILKKPVGTYVTLEAPDMEEPDEAYHVQLAGKLAGELQKLVRHMDIHRTKDGEYFVLVAGLGNREVTPDALGPYVVDQLKVNRHIVEEYGRYAIEKHKIHLVSAIVPGVMAKTGMESAEIIRGLVKELHPDFVVAVDALAARNTKRLNRTIQLADTGIHPGSGVGNRRNGITRKNVGVPVIALGVPTVVDAATIVNDTMEQLLEEIEHCEALKGVGSVLKGCDSAQKYQLIRELISPPLHGMFVTPKDVDETVRQISHTISDSLNMLFA